MAIDRTQLFTKASQRVTLRILEKYYRYLLENWIRAENNKDFYGASRWTELDRTHRIRLKACEVLLCNLGSQLFKDGETPNFKKTRTIAGRATVSNKGKRSYAKGASPIG
jgi:hypothetical protein